ncbi:sialate O-acetylesterase [Rudanella paleaurantiibacter]|nr:sialate O-acetylesterase [Rudanella paleaurantiibacter]
MSRYSMPSFYRFLFLLFSTLTIQAQSITLSTPQARVVYQRALNNEARVPVTGIAPTGTTRIEARLLPLTEGLGTSTNWQSLSFINGTTAFRGHVRAQGGWYQLQVRAKAGFAVLAQTTLNRVGVGEVFVVAGQSNALGVFEESVDATDDRVSCIDSRQDDPAEQCLLLPFSRAGAKTNVGPANPPYIWTILGDSLTRRLNVPVLFLGAAQGGTSSSEWAQTASGVGPAYLSPYRRLGVALRHYAARTGLRAVLWHQGESDNLGGTSVQTYVNNLLTVIQKTRQQTGFAQLPWLMSRASYISGTTSNAIIQAQNNLITSTQNIWPGPETDLYTSDSLRLDGLHFGGNKGLSLLATLWNERLSGQFFNSATPFMPDSVAMLTTGYILPLSRRPGDTLSVPFVQTAPLLPGNLFRLQLARATDEVIVAQSELVTDQDPIRWIIPNRIGPGVYRVRVQTTSPVLNSSWSEPFQIDPVAAPAINPAPSTPFVTGGQPDPAIVRIGYRYDAPTHGFEALVWASEPVEIRMQRLDGGLFTDTNWTLASPTANFPSFNQFRNYPPVALGVGGIEWGRYRLSVRRQGDTGTGVWVEGTFLDKRHTVYIANETAPTPKSLPDQADLALQMHVDKRVVPVGGYLTYTIQVTNNGPDDATHIGLTDRLPDALQFGTSTGVSALSGVLSTTLAGLEPGATQSLTFSAVVRAPGVFDNRAEITALDQTDPNSLPGSGTDDGENDMAGTDVRTLDGVLTRRVSPNPNGRVLPPVLSNQPLPDSTHTDLSLTTELSRRVAQPGDTLQLQIRVTNAGGLSASAVSVQTTLPAGWQLLPTAGQSQTGGVVMVPIGLIDADQTGTQVLILRVGAVRGPFQLRCEISTATGTDLDSTPGNGNLNRGEDDEAVADGRIR